MKSNRISTSGVKQSENLIDKKSLYVCIFTLELVYQLINDKNNDKKKQMVHLSSDTHKMNGYKINSCDYLFYSWPVFRNSYEFSIY